jgi:lipopolysaccharide/colanic/teichoic acid biosynthesis glycosyltransferase
MTKRLLDIVLAAIALAILFPVLVIVAVLVRLDSPGPVIFKQQRIGRDFAPFTIFKLRTMANDASGLEVTAGGDSRITRVGRVLRRTKLDEVPQLVNVLKGEMSLVGPRPEVATYVDMFREDFEKILVVRPGLTDLASIYYVDEEETLEASGDPITAYVEILLPHKIELAKEYVRTQSLLLDLEIILRTVVSIGRSGVRRG